jgi:hypothetical protein
VTEVAEAVRVAPAPAPPRGAADLLLDGFALRCTEGYAAAAPIFKEALRAFRRETLMSPHEARWPGV